MSRRATLVSILIVGCLWVVIGGVARLLWSAWMHWRTGLKMAPKEPEAGAPAGTVATVEDAR